MSTPATPVLTVIIKGDSYVIPTLLVDHGGVTQEVHLLQTKLENMPVDPEALKMLVEGPMPRIESVPARAALSFWASTAWAVPGYQELSTKIREILNATRE